jgi:hypothetical protein
MQIHQKIPDFFERSRGSAVILESPISERFQYTFGTLCERDSDSDPYIVTKFGSCLG